MERAESLWYVHMTLVPLQVRRVCVRLGFRSQYFLKLISWITLANVNLLTWFHFYKINTITPALVIVQSWKFQVRSQIWKWLWKYRRQTHVKLLFPIWLYWPKNSLCRPMACWAHDCWFWEWENGGALHQEDADEGREVAGRSWNLTGKTLETSPLQPATPQRLTHSSSPVAVPEWLGVKRSMVGEKYSAQQVLYEM